MFACVQSADTHVNGWHAVKRVCTDAAIEDIEKMTATKMRHRISTLYAVMDVLQNERIYFYKHMGHSADINANIYQVPLAAAEIVMVGSRLQQLDGSSAAAKVTCCATGYTTSTTTIHSVDDNAVQLEETAPAQVTYCDDSNTTHHQHHVILHHHLLQHQYLRRSLSHPIVLPASPKLCAAHKHLTWKVFQHCILRYLDVLAQLK